MFYLTRDFFYVLCVLSIPIFLNYNEIMYCYEYKNPDTILLQVV